MHEIKAYQCDYCKKYGKSKSNIKRHEGECFHNPITKACATCANLTQEVYKVNKRNVFGDFQGDVYDSIPKCTSGKNISRITDNGKEVTLQHHCEYWAEINESDSWHEQEQQ